MSKEEIWKVIPFAPRYKASSLGRLIGVRDRIMNPSPNHRGYLVCDLNYVQYRVNRIICITFHGEPPTSVHHAAHRDSDLLNNREDNLYWATPAENAADLSATGKNKGDRSGHALLNSKDVLTIRQLHREGVKVAIIQRQFPRVCYSTVSHIIHRRSWEHLP